ncbi:MFS transporter [Streptomyces sp. NRRL S-1448]|uniref:MFS transporter n=1 Tax=Streptomyces sp. NRRL S-1448 TaxID=1463883 RepID=UPI000691B68E|nr:MFS transporter [Streptomyces sp. NRRL S-1448]
MPPVILRSMPVNVRLLGIAVFFNLLGRGAFMASSALYFTRFAGVTPGQLGVGLAVAGATGLVSGVPFGHLADRRGQRDVAAVLLILSALAAVFFLVVDGFVQFTAVAVVFTFIERGAYAARQAVLSTLTAGADATLARAQIRTIGNLGVAIGSGIAGLAIWVDTQEAYMGVIGFNAASYLICGLIFFALPRIAAVPVQPGASKLPVLRDRRYTAATMVNMIMVIHFAMLDIGFPLWIAQHTNAPHWMTAVLILFNTAGCVLFQISASRRIGTLESARRSWRLAGFLFLGTCVLTGLADGASALGACVLLLVAAGLHLYGEIIQSAAGWVISIDLAPAGQNGQYQGLFTTGFAFSQMVAPFVISTLVIENGTIGWVCLGATFALAGIAMTPVLRIGDGASSANPCDKEIARS